MLREIALEARPVVRNLIRNRWRTLLVVTMLSLTLGVALAIGRIADPILLRPLPHPDSDRLYVLQSLHEMPDGRVERVQSGVIDFTRWRADNTLFEGVEAMRPQSLAISGSGAPSYVDGASVTAGLFEMLGTSPFMGRHIAPDEDVPGSNVCMISFGFWRERFGSDPGVIGREIRVDGVSRRIVGVMPRGFRLLNRDMQVWTALGLDPANPGVGRFLTTVARAKAGASHEGLSGEISRISAALEKELPRTHAGWKVRVLPLREFLFESRRDVVVLLGVAVAGLFLIAAVNLANLALARVEESREDLAVRAALGSPRRRVVSAIALESLLSGLAGGAGGLVLSGWIVRGVLRFDERLAQSIGDVSVNWRLGVAAVGASVLASVLVMVLPALRASRLLSVTLAARGVAGSRRGMRLSRALLVAQVAIATLLLVTGGVLLSGLRDRFGTDTRLDATNILTFQTRLAGERYDDRAERADFVARLVPRLEALPGVDAAAVTVNLFDEENDVLTMFRVEGQTEDSPVSTSRFRRATPGYFEMMRIRVLEGREFEATDDIDAPPVAIVSRAFADVYWPDRSAIGRSISRTGNNPAAIVVGVVDDVWDLGYVGGPSPTLYTPFAQTPAPFVSGVVRVKGRPEAIAPMIAKAVGEVDPDQPVEKIMTLDAALARSVHGEALRGAVTAGLGLAGLLVAAMGIHATISWGLAQRTREIGVRLAIGASGERVFALVMMESMRLAAIGIVSGLTLVLLAGRLAGGFGGLQFTTDPVIAAIVVVVVLAASVGSTLLPAWRIARLDPVKALEPR